MQASVKFIDYFFLKIPALLLDNVPSLYCLKSTFAKSIFKGAKYEASG